MSTLDGRKAARGEFSVESQDAEAAGGRLAEAVLADGGAQILEALGVESAP